MQRIISRFTLIFGVVLSFMFLTALIQNHYKQPYKEAKDITFVADHELQSIESLSLVTKNTVVDRSEDKNSSLFSDCYYALLINETDKEVLVNKNAYTRMYPASMTKLVTASVICDKIEAGELALTDIVKVQHSYNLTNEGVEPCPLTYGCTLTIKDLLYGLLIQSNNYYALILAEYVSGDVDSFAELMNEKAYSIGATNSHFVNPHGLDRSEHYTTAYDIYLILKEAYNHDLIREICTYDKYSFAYKTSAGESVGVDCEATNFFLIGYADLPANVTIKAWKTGTTTGAGNCLAMYITKNDKDYVVIASSGESKTVLYEAIVRLICMIE